MMGVTSVVPTNTMKLKYSHMRVKDSFHNKCDSRRNRYDDLKGTVGTGGVGAYKNA